MLTGKMVNGQNGQLANLSTGQIVKWQSSHLAKWLYLCHMLSLSFVHKILPRNCSKILYKRRKAELLCWVLNNPNRLVLISTLIEDL